MACLYVCAPTKEGRMLSIQDKILGRRIDTCPCKRCKLAVLTQLRLNNISRGEVLEPPFTVRAFWCLAVLRLRSRGGEPGNKATDLVHPTKRKESPRKVSGETVDRRIKKCNVSAVCCVSAQDVRQRRMLRDREENQTTSQATWFTYTEINSYNMKRRNTTEWNAKYNVLKRNVYVTMNMSIDKVTSDNAYKINMHVVQSTLQYLSYNIKAQQYSRVRGNWSPL